jgi:hypothetical protein
MLFELVMFELLHERTHAPGAQHVGTEKTILGRRVGTKSPLGKMARIRQINPVDTGSSGLAKPRDQVADIKDEAGVGNCFPGLECDLRNLERRFFPFLEVDIDDNRITL